MFLEAKQKRGRFKQEVSKCYSSVTHPATYMAWKKCLTKSPEGCEANIILVANIPEVG